VANFGAASGIIADDISGPGNPTQGGTGVVSLTGTNTYSGATNINAGATLQVGNGGTNGTLGTGSVNNAGILRFNRSDDTTYAGVITGSGTLSKQGAGTLTLASVSTSP